MRLQSYRIFPPLLLHSHYSHWSASLQQDLILKVKFRFHQDQATPISLELTKFHFLREYSSEL